MNQTAKHQNTTTFVKNPQKAYWIINTSLIMLSVDLFITKAPMLTNIPHKTEAVIYRVKNPNTSILLIPKHPANNFTSNKKQVIG